MRRTSVPTSALLVIVGLAGAGCLEGPDPARANLEVGAGPTVTAAEASLGIEFPPGSEILRVSDEAKVYGVVFLTALSVQGAQGFLANELAAAGLTVSRDFGINPSDSDTHTTASYRKGSENWSIIIATLDNGTTEVCVFRQY